MKRLPQIAVGKSWFRLLAVIIPIFILLPPVFSACTAEEKYLSIACMSATDSGDDSCDPLLVLEVRIYNSTDGMPIPQSSIYTGHGWLNDDNGDGVIIDTFFPYDFYYDVLPCHDYCEGEGSSYAHTKCLEDGRTWDISVRATADGYVIQTDTLTLDNRSDYVVMTFYLDPL